MAQKNKTSRRTAVKTIVGGVTALAAYNVLPTKWGVPVVEQIFLPAHAATSGVTGSLTLVTVNAGGDVCGGAGETLNATGTVAAPDGRSMVGVQVRLRYMDDPDDGTYGDEIVTVQAGNTFSFSGLVTPDVGSFSGFPYQVVASFVDQATYGTSTASASGNCTP